MKKIYTTFCLLFWVVSLQAQVNVRTVTPQMSGSGGLSLDSLGNLYISDFGDFLSASDGHLNNVYKLDRQGNLTTYVTGFQSASGSAFDSNGILFQADIGAGQVYKIVNGNKVLFSSGLNQPVGLDFDDTGNLYVCNCGGASIQKITPQGVSTVFSSGSLFRCPNGITHDFDGNIYVSNFSDGWVIKITAQGVASRFANIQGGNNGHVRFSPVDTSLYVCSHGSHKIFKLDLAGNVSNFAGSGIRGNQDGSAATAQFSRPNGIVLTPSGDSMYINSSVPLTNVPNNPLNPSLIRMLSGIQGGSVSIGTLHDVVPVTVYPNPARDLVRFEWDQIQDIKLSIYNNMGKLVHSIDSKKSKYIEWNINLYNIPFGIYYYSINNNKINYSNSFIIE